MMKVLRWLLILVLLVVAGVCALASYLVFTQSGRDVLVKKVNGYTSKLATPVVLGRIEGNIFSDVRLAHVTVADAGGVWLTVEGVRLVWHPMALWYRTAPFEVLEVASMDMARLPVAETAKTQSGGAVNPLDYLVYVPRTLRLEDMVIEAPVTGQRHRLRAEIVSGGAVQAVSVSTLEGPMTTVSGTVTVGGLSEGAVDLHVREAPEGLLGGLMKLPKTAEIVAEVMGSARGGVFTLEKAEVQAGQSHVVMQGGGTKDGSRLVGTMQAAVPDLGEWQGWLGDTVHGAVYGGLEVSGSLQELGYGLQVSRTDIAVGDVRVAGGAAAVSGTVNVVGTGTPFTAKGDITGRLTGVGQGVYPLAIRLDVSGTQAALAGTLKAGMVRKGERADIVVGGAGVVSPVALNGMVSGTWVQGANRFVLSGGVEANPARAVLKDLRLTGPGTVVSGSGVVDLVTKLVDGQASVRVADLRPLAALGGIMVTGGMDADVVARARKGVQVGEVNVGQFEVTYGTYVAKLKQAARLVWDGRSGSLSAFELEVAGGTVTAQGRMNADMVDGGLAVQNVDAEQLIDSDVISGRINLTAKVTGRSAAPVVMLNGDMAGKTGTYPLEVKLAGDWRGAQLGLTADVKSNTATAHADVTLGGGLSLLPFKLGIGTDSRISGTVTGDVGLEMFNPLLWASRQQVGGRLSGAVNLGGTIATPLVNGKFTLADGSYNQSTSGVCLKNVGAEIVGSRDFVEVTNLKSTDGLGGDLAGTVRLGLAGTRPLTGDVHLDNLQLFCGGLATGNVGGDVTVRGVLADHTVGGKVVVGPLNVQLPGNSTETDIPHVETVRVKAGADENAAPATITRLALSVDAPQRIYVRGRGLDAEFGGALTVGGLAQNPLLTGSLKGLRGNFTLLDRKLVLGDTEILFEGPMPPSPYLNIKATTTAQGTAITLAVTGAATKPQLALTSDPSLPQDEVLALLLFGRQLANISAFEALQLAQATRVLAGLDSGKPGILDKARKTLGLDTLDVGSGSTSSDVTVTTGKYLTDKIYVSVQQGAEPGDREVETEIELTPSVTGNTTVNGEGGQSFGLEWKRNY